MLISKQMKKTALKTTKDVVTNKYVLYVVLFIAFMNVLAYLATSNFIGLTLFCLIGFLTTYFTKNMVIVLLVAIIVSSFLHISRRTVEGMKNKGSKKSKKKVKAADEYEPDEPAPTDDEENDNTDDNDKPVMTKGAKINHQKTVEESYKNLHNILGNENFQQMTKDTKQLMKQQEQLTKSLEGMAPLLKSAQGMLKGLDLDKMNKMMSSFDLAGLKDKVKKN